MTIGSTKTWRLVPLALGLSLLGGLPRVLAAQEAGADGGLQPGDLVEVTVWQRDELSGEFTVGPDGSLNHPLYREIRVTDIPVSQVEERLRNFLGAFEANPQVVVQPYYKVTVAGSVMRPDIYDLPPGTTVSQAVTRAGGVTEGGDREDVMLTRNTTEIELDLSEAEAVRMPVRSGDQILVKSESRGGFRETVLPLVQVGFTIANLVVYVTRSR